jgi:Rrf2 family protein
MNFFSHRSTLAVIAVLDIALRAAERPLSAKSLAERCNLAPRYLEPLLQSLVHAGVLKGVRGPRGGYLLGRPPADLTVGGIMRAAQEPPGAMQDIVAANSLAAVIAPGIKCAERLMSDALSKITLDTLKERAIAAGLDRA